jgi:hypothetical protein
MKPPETNLKRVAGGLKTVATVGKCCTVTDVHMLHWQERCGCQRQSESSFLHEGMNTNDPSGFLPLGLAGSSFFCLPGCDQLAIESVTMT